MPSASDRDAHWRRHTRQDAHGHTGTLARTPRRAHAPSPSPSPPPSPCLCACASSVHLGTGGGVGVPGLLKPKPGRRRRRDGLDEYMMVGLHGKGDDEACGWLGWCACAAYARVLFAAFALYCHQECCCILIPLDVLCRLAARVYEREGMTLPALHLTRCLLEDARVGHCAASHSGEIGRAHV